MAAIEHVKIEIEEDFMARQTRAEPVHALAELIWNSVDADASHATIEFEFKDLAEGMSKIVVYDDGQGIPRDQAKQLFGHLGGSWKRLKRRTSTKDRMVHGQEGRGRYKAFALGRAADWKVCYLVLGVPKSYTISLLESDLKDVAISDERSVPGQKPGVIVEITDLKRDFRGLHSPAGLQELAEIFALYLINYKDVQISVHGNIIDPSGIITNKEDVPLTPIQADGHEHAAQLEIIEWGRETKRALYLCNAEGFPLSQVDTRFHVGQFYFSAYLKSDYITALHNDERLGIAEMEPTLQAVVEEGRTKIKEYFRDRAAARARTIVDEWKAAQVYPFEGEAANVVERAERQVFDIVAVSVHDYTPEARQAPAKTTALHLRMLRSALERSPSELQLIINEVLQLPLRKRQELAELLQETTLSAVITAAKTVADRLKFISGLESILFDAEKKDRLKERSQLHQIVADNTWIFGDEYYLWVNDKSLTRVLQKHKEHLDPNIIIDEPVKVVGQTRGIVDLMLSRTVRRNRADDIEHLVIELKAPSVTIGDKEIAQTNKYAIAVAGNERFRTVPGVRWHFWAVSNDMTEYAKRMVQGGPDRNRRLVYKEDNISVGVKTWGEIIEENRARLQFFQEHLQYIADESTALRYLQERHKRFLEGVIEDPLIPEEVAKGGQEPELEAAVAEAARGGLPGKGPRV
jgi:hypothetical protein